MSALPTAIGAYQIIGKLGEGSECVVLEAAKHGRQRHVALKVFRAAPLNAGERLRTEAYIASKIDHPGVVRVHAAETTQDGQPLLTMELLPGETLGQRLRKKEPLPVLTSLRWAQQLAEALAAIHALGIVHRDVAPENLIIVADWQTDGSERLKLCDFGAARLRSPPTDGVGRDLVPLGVPVGTPLCMSPEHWQSGRDADDKADVYSVGVILHYMLAGAPPFSAASDGALMALHILAAPASLAQTLPRLPARLPELVQRMLAKAPASRPAMAQVAADLRELAAEEKQRHGWRPPPQSAPPKDEGVPAPAPLPPAAQPDAPIPSVPRIQRRAEYSMEDAERDAGMVMEPYMPWVLRAYPRVRWGLTLFVLVVMLAIAAFVWTRMHP